MTDPEPALPTLSRELGSLDFPLQQRSRAEDDRPFALAGARLHATGGRARGVDEVRCTSEAGSESPPLLSRLRVEGARPEESVLTPLGMERRLALGDARLVERVVVAPSAPVCFFEWTTDVAATLTLTWTAPGSKGRSLGRGVAADTERGRILYLFSRAPAELTVPSGGTLHVRARLELAGGESVRLAVAGVAPTDDEARILRVMGRTQVVAPARRAESQRILSDRLSIDTPEDALSEALAWAKLGLSGAAPLFGSAVDVSDRGLRLALAALACGESGPARDLVSHAGTDLGGRQLLIVARYLAWTGDLATVKEAWKGIRADAEAALAAVSEGERDRVRDIALRDLVVVAEEVGDPELADRLRAAVTEEEAVIDLRPAEDGPDQEVESDRDEALGWAAVVESVVGGLLGAEPDAPRGRLVLRPRLPASWDRFELLGLSVGEAAVDMAYGRTGGIHRFTLRQARGGAPLRVILEPELEGERVVAARVDGAPAELDPLPAEGRLRVPVQVVLDHERRVEVELRGAVD